MEHPTSALEPAVRHLLPSLLPSLTFIYPLTPISEFAQGKVDPTEAGKKGGQTSGTAGGDDSSAATGGDYKPTEHGGLKQDGTPDGRVKQ